MQPQVDLIHDAQDADRVVQDVEQGVKAVKEGYRTSEFWVMIGSQVALWSNTPGGTAHLQMVKASVSAVLTIAYAGFRTYLKSRI
jgi:hypothetical protein